MLDAIAPGQAAQTAAKTYDAVIIGSGHNGLVCANYLARKGLKVAVLERRHVIGGAAVTEEIAPGFRRFLFQAHTVFYTEEAGFILIRAVLHQAREIKRDLFD